GFTSDVALLGAHHPRRLVLSLDHRLTATPHRAAPDQERRWPVASPPAPHRGVTLTNSGASRDTAPATPARFPPLRSSAGGVHDGRVVGGSVRVVPGLHGVQDPTIDVGHCSEPYACPSPELRFFLLHFPMSGEG